MLPAERLAILLEPFALRPEEAAYVRSSQNVVYAHPGRGERCIVRISADRFRTTPQIDAELAWIDFLATRGLRVCRSLPTVAGARWATREIDGTTYVVTCFAHAPGRGILPDDIAPPLYHKLGALLGQMHVAAMDHQANHKPLARPAWHESRLLREDFATHAAALTVSFRGAADRLVQHLRALPTTPTTHGLIHADFSVGNCFLHEGELWVFDFDNCEYGLFAQDLATVLYDSIYCRVLNKFADPGLNRRIAPLWSAFLRGYSQTGPLTTIDQSVLKDFFLLREAVLYVHYHRTLDLRTASDSLQAGLDVMRRNVETQSHQVDFSALPDL